MSSFEPLPSGGAHPRSLRASLGRSRYSLLQSRFGRRCLAALATSFFLALCLPTPFPRSAHSQSSSTGSLELTPLLASPLAPAQPVLADDGRIHLPYELLVMNLSSGGAQIDVIDTLDGDDRSRVLGTLTGSELDAANHPWVHDVGPELGPGQVTRVFLDLTFDGAATLPSSLAHRFAVTLTPPGGTSASRTITSGVTQVGRQAAIVLDPPLAGSRWLIGGGCCFPPTPHRLATNPLNGAIYVAERFAIDFVRLNDDGRFFAGPQTEVSSYAYYGVPLLAVSDGTVVRAVDAEPDQVPSVVSSNLSVQEALGNYVVLDISGGRFAFYAHMKPGSVRVNVGDSVTRGQTLGLLGNSGNTDAPHLHFHVMDGPEPLLSNGLPYVFRSFDVEGVSTGTLQDIVDGRPLTIEPSLTGRHQNQMPLDNQLVAFPTP